jgi:hypothetical protein
MKSSGESAEKKSFSWADARKAILSSSDSKQWYDLRSWVSKQKATRRIKHFGKDLNVICAKTRRMQVGDHGICRFRALLLSVEADQFSAKEAQFLLGTLYTIREISADKQWIKVAACDGFVGWLEARNHLYISPGEFKILSAGRRIESVNFIVNSLSYAR